MNSTLPVVQGGRPRASQADLARLEGGGRSWAGRSTSGPLAEHRTMEGDPLGIRVTGCYDRVRGYVRAALRTDAGTLTLVHETGRFSGALPAELLGTLRMDLGWSAADVQRATTRAADGIVLVDLWAEPGDGLIGTVVGHALGGLSGTGGGPVAWVGALRRDRHQAVSSSSGTAAS